MPKTIYRQKSNSVSAQGVANLLDGVLLAYEKYISLNRYITINLFDIFPDGPQEFLTSFFDLYRRFAKSKGFEAAYVWVLENNLGDNLHVHILLHMPSNSQHRWINAFKRKVKIDLLKCTKSETADKNWFHCKTVQYGCYFNPTLLRRSFHDLKSMVIKTPENAKLHPKRINQYYLQAGWGRFEFYHIVNVVGYLLKGHYRHTQGLIDGRRFGRSHNLCSPI